MCYVSDKNECLVENGHCQRVCSNHNKMCVIFQIRMSVWWRMVTASMNVVIRKGVIHVAARRASHYPQIDTPAMVCSSS